MKVLSLLLQATDLSVTPVPHRVVIHTGLHTQRMEQGDSEEGMEAFTA